MHVPFTYLGYKGIFSLSESKRFYTGLVDQTVDQVTFEASSLSALQANFEAAVEEYIKLHEQVASEIDAYEPEECRLFVHVTDQLDRFDFQKG